MTSDQARVRVDETRRSGEPIALADALVVLAGTLVPAGELADARTALDEAAAINESAGRSEDERHCRQFSATLSRLLGDVDGAARRARRAAVLSADSSPAAVSAAAELGETAMAAGDAASAARAFGIALQHAKSVALHPADRAGLLRKQAAALASADDPVGAVAALDEASGALETSGDRVQALRVRIEAITALQNAGRQSDAAPRRGRALDDARRYGDAHALADLELLEGAAALERGDGPAALAAAIRARDHALQANAPVSYIAAVATMTELYERAGDRLNAYATLATGWATLADFLGPDAGREAFAPKLMEYRRSWGEETFRRIKSAYENRH